MDNDTVRIPGLRQALQDLVDLLEVSRHNPELYHQYLRCRRCRICGRLIRDDAVTDLCGRHRGGWQIVFRQP